jgi:NitT/TauT family transport system substrate-binding protein
MVSVPRRLRSSRAIRERKMQIREKCRRFAGAVSVVVIAVHLSAPVYAQERIKFGLDWVISGQHAPLFVAKEKGYYKEAGLDVTILRGYGSADAVKSVAVGNVDIGFGDAGALVLARSEGLKVKAVAMIYSNAPYSLVIRDDADIKKPSDLQGLTIAAPAGGGGRAMFPAFAKLTNIDESKIKWLTIDSSSLLPALISNRAVALATMYVQRATDEARAAEAGVKVHSVKYADYGLQMYSNALLVSDDYLQRKPEVVRKFVAATIRGIIYSFDHPEEAARLLVESHQELSEKLVVQDVLTVRDLALSEEIKKNGFGFMSEERFISTRDIVSSVYKNEAAKVIDVKTLFTNEFLPP